MIFIILALATFNIFATIRATKSTSPLQAAWIFFISTIFTLGFAGQALSEAMEKGNLTSISAINLTILAIGELTVICSFIIAKLVPCMKAEDSTFFSTKKDIATAAFTIAFSTYIISLKIGILKIGLDVELSLPFRLNGILRCTSLYILPLITIIIIKNWKAAFLATFSLGLSNLLFTGSKFAFATPLIIYCLYFLDSKSLKKLIAPAAAALALYVLINPYAFRDGLSSGKTLLETIDFAIDSAWTALSNSPTDSLTVSLSALTGRVTGLNDLKNCISAAPNLHPFEPNVFERYNISMGIGTDTNLATGCIGFFVILFASPWGSAFGILTLFAVQAALIPFERAIHHKSLARTILAPMAVLVVDGRFEFASSWLDIIFTAAAIIFIDRIIAIKQNHHPFRHPPQSPLK